MLDDYCNIFQPSPCLAENEHSIKVQKILVSYLALSYSLPCPKLILNVSKILEIETIF